MCKYCRHLADLRDQDKIYYKYLIKAWQRTCARQEKLLIGCIGFLKGTYPVDNAYIRQLLIDEIEKELRKDTVHD